MKVARARRRGTLCGVAVLFLAASTAAAQEPLAKAKELYHAAHYEEALTILEPVQVPEAQQYKALCMLALGRAEDASGAVERLVTSAPTFEPSSEDVPPRFVSLVSETRKRLLPGIARRTFNEAREQFRSGNREEALKKFDLVVTLASVSGFSETTDAEDLTTLASGFLDLARAEGTRVQQGAPPPAAVSAAAPLPSAEPGPVNAPSSAAQSPAQAASAPPSPVLPTDVSQPVAVRQTIPPLPSGVSGFGDLTASVRVQIGADGRVVGASMQQPSHPLYDRLVLQAARDWLYTPAMLNGRPVPSEKVVTIQLR